jgi:predicted hydrolase (HD superfamily)
MATCEELGLERDEFLEISLEAMKERADELGL